MKKIVIMIGGTGRSGSTMLDLMLGNANNAFSCGELYGLFRPQKRSELSLRCNCNNPECSIWHVIKYYGEANVYKALFEKIPDLKFIIDSSKSLAWVRDQIKYNKNSFIELKHILIWKEPLNFAHSRWKRGALKGWRKSWANYHRGYFTIVPFFRSIKLEDLTSSPSYKLKSLCKYLQMEYFPGKECYWKKKHHIIFGSKTAIDLLYKNGEKRIYQYTRNGEFQGIESRLKEIIDNDEEIQKILQVLKITDINQPLLSREELQHIIMPLQINPLWIDFEKIRQCLKTFAVKCRII
ncbi:MAG: hypothetical protein J7J33_04435 [Caldisericia bacterium]|nr:hypothetical protein [Caldisericia bacterium]